MSAKQSEGKLVSVRGNRCLVPWSVIPVDSFDTILDVVRAGKYETMILSNSNHKKNSHHEFDNAITTKN